MKIRAELLQSILYVVVTAGWLAFAAIFIFRPKTPAGPTRKRKPASILGLALQGASYAIVWIGLRRPLAAQVPQGEAGPGLLLLLATLLLLALELGSLWMIFTAVRALGKQWSLTARVTEGHQLIVEGPYRIVRNPIYTGMLGMLLVTGVVFSRWPFLLVAVAVFMSGTIIRIRTEERLLRETFGPQFEAYSGRVRALIPGLY